MKPCVVYNTPFAITSRLSLFGCETENLEDIANSAASSRNEASPLHPTNAPGTFSYMAGVAALRLIFMQIDGWGKYVSNGVEGVENKARSLLVLFQNVDRACGEHDPNPVSQKGDAITKLVDNPSRYLWPHMEEAKAKENTSVWFFCVSCNGDEVRAELSRPRAIEKGNFGTFAERIFIIQNDDWRPPGRPTNDENLSQDEIDVPVSKKI